jgi:isochorismate pyruvate lyase
LALLRFDICHTPIRVPKLPGTAPAGLLPVATTASPDVQGQLRAARLAGEAQKVKLCNGSRLWHCEAMTEIRDPADCTTMTEVRTGVDDVDRQVVALLKRRFGYMEAAARIKPDRSAVRDEWRKADVLAKVDVEANKLGIDREMLARVYEDLVETSIAYELDLFDRTRA